MTDSGHASLKDLHALLDLVKSSVASIEKSFVASKQPFPSLNGPFNPASEAVRMSPDVQEATGLLVAAASQLIATVRPPHATILAYTLQVRVFLDTCE